MIQWHPSRLRLRSVVVAAGGDGTLNAVARAVFGSGCAFGVLPQGTFSAFSRTHGIPTDIGAAMQVLLHGREAALRRWSAAGADMVLGGHVHLPFMLPLHGRWAGLPQAIRAVQAGTAVSCRVRAEASNSVNLIRIARPAGGAATQAPPARQAQGERWDHAVAAGAFECVSVHRLAADDER